MAYSIYIVQINDTLSLATNFETTYYFFLRYLPAHSHVRLLATLQ